MEVPGREKRKYCEMLTKKGKRCRNYGFCMRDDVMCVCKLHSSSGKRGQNQIENENQKENENEKEAEECSICFNALRKGTYELKCQHVFHKMCIEKFFSHRFLNKQSMSCPLCRIEYSVLNVLQSDIFK